MRLHLYTTLQTAVLVALLIFSTSVATANTVETTDGSESTAIEVLMNQVWLLQTLIQQRLEYPTNLIPTDENREDYFSLTASPATLSVFGNKKATAVIETDGSVEQIILVKDCDDDLLITVNKERNCLSESWYLMPKSDGESGIKQFPITVQAQSTEVETTGEIKVYACRFDGCRLEQNLPIAYKETKEFTDSVMIETRYDYTYEYEDEEYYVQELLLDFPARDVKRLTVRTDCENSQYRFRVYEKNRVSCSTKNRISRSLFDQSYFEDKSFGYMLLLEFAVKKQAEDELGTVDLTFEFTDEKNRVHTVSYTL